MLLTACNDSSDCDGNENNPGLMSEIESNLEKWHTVGIQNYSFYYSLEPADCPTVDPAPAVVITVEQGEVVSVYVPDSGHYLDSISGYETIDEVFQSMLQKANCDFRYFSKGREALGEYPQFDPTYGYPVSYYYDKSRNSCDGESMLIRDFQ
jgi:hypothetical protein